VLQLAEKSSISVARSVCVYGMAGLTSSQHFRQEVLAPLNFSYDSAQLTNVPIPDKPGKFYDYYHFDRAIYTAVSSFELVIGNGTFKISPGHFHRLLRTLGGRVARFGGVQARATTGLYRLGSDWPGVQDPRLHASLLHRLSIELPGLRYGQFFVRRKFGPAQPKEGFLNTSFSQKKRCFFGEKVLVLSKRSPTHDVLSKIWDIAYRWIGIPTIPKNFHISQSFTISLFHFDHGI